MPQLPHTSRHQSSEQGDRPFLVACRQVRVHTYRAPLVQDRHVALCDVGLRSALCCLRRSPWLSAVPPRRACTLVARSCPYSRRTRDPRPPATFRTAARLAARCLKARAAGGWPRPVVVAVAASGGSWEIRVQGCWAAGKWHPRMLTAFPSTLLGAQSRGSKLFISASRLLQWMSAMVVCLECAQEGVLRTRPHSGGHRLRAKSRQRMGKRALTSSCRRPQASGSVICRIVWHVERLMLSASTSAA